MLIGSVMELINYDTLVQHKAVRNHVIFALLFFPMMYLFVPALLYWQLTEQSYQISENEKKIFIIAIILSLCFSIIQSILYYKYKTYNLTRRIVFSMVLTTIIILLFSDFVLKLISVMLCIISLILIKKRQHKLDYRYIHYLKCESEKNEFFNTIFMIIGQLIIMINLFVDLSLTAITLIMSIGFYIMALYFSSVEYGYSIYLKNSPFDEKTLNRELKLYEKDHGKIKVNSEIKKYRKTK